MQNIDQTLQFYENENYSFKYSWNSTSKRKFPLEFTYLPYIDLLIIVDELFTIKCYQYKELAMNSSDNNENHEKNCTPEWSYQFSEFVIDIQTVQLTKWFIVVLGERNLLVLRDNGTLFFVKKFDVNPTCLFAFANDNKDSLIILIGTEKCNMLIYQNDVLRWATKIPFVPICVRRGNFNDITGSIVLLSDQGQLSAGYLGTNPSLKIISMPTVEDHSNTHLIEKELKELKKLINSEDKNQSLENDCKITDCININIVNCQTKNVDLFTISLELVPLASMKNVKIIFHQNDFYEINPNEQIFTNLDSLLPMELDVKLKINQLPLTSKICCSFMFTNDVLKIINKKLYIPFENMIKLNTASIGKYKYSLKINVQKISNEKANLKNLFDHILSPDHSNKNSFSFNFNNYEKIQTNIKLILTENILYVIESNDLAGLYLTFKELFKRFDLKMPERKIPIISFIFNFNPIEQLCLHIKQRIDNKNLLIKYKEEMGKFSQYYRILQKRILVKCKDKTPTSLDNLEKLLNLIHKKVIIII